MPKHVRPWLRFIEGTGGAQAGNGVPGNGAGTGAAGDAGSGDTGSDQGTGDRGSGDGDKGGDGGGEGEPPAPKSTPPEPKQSEPTPKPEPKAGEKADNDDSAEVAALKAELAEMKDAVATLTEAHQKDTEEKRAKLTEDVAEKAGLPEGMASRLQGDTREQLEADAKNLAQTLGFRVVDPTQGRGAGGGGRMKSMSDAIQAKIAAAGLK